ncbi:capsule biosynthesis protein CapC [Psittacicella hinzii]|uniref:Capsule biosynthesis protein CapC n=1 Tax=Psittacicella hinzii TaxID=2028575 RepID=A0A3A1Y9R2_9GAMM|nr:stealth conserved region 3 domain-containing protein [Psittacicella hinzii]RIY32874.1 capsule biosynthesis protein CapC [Psittacicella hinzii]
MLKKTKKLLTKPNIFFRDYLLKKFPIKNIEQPFVESEEPLVVNLSRRLETIIEKNLVEQTNVDVVFTWVDGNDSFWKDKFSLYSGVSINAPALFAADQARFEDHNEIYFSVQSVLKFLPWVRKIFIVTDGQIPSWYNSSYPYKDKVVLVDHQDIIPTQYLPTFNSHVIEAFLYKIPDLNENFIYFNDDVFVARELNKSHFFQPNGLASLFLTDKSLKQMRARGKLTATLEASYNSLQLLQGDYEISIDSPTVHTYFPLKKSMYELAWQKYGDEIRKFLPAKIRSKQDLNMATFLVPWLMYLEGKASIGFDACYYFNIRSNHSLFIYQKLLNGKRTGILPHSFCANDFHSKEEIPNYRENLLAMLKKFYHKD